MGKTRDITNLSHELWTKDVSHTIHAHNISIISEAVFNIITFDKDRQGIANLLDYLNGNTTEPPGGIFINLVRQILIFKQVQLFLEIKFMS